MNLPALYSSISSHLQEISIWIIFWFLEACIIAIIYVPIKRFLESGWEVRKQEFMNRLAAKDIYTYLSRYWAKSLKSGRIDIRDDNEVTLNYVYDLIVAKALYRPPVIILCALIALFGGFVIATAFRNGYENYIKNYVDWIAQEGKYAPVDLLHMPVSSLNAVIFPFSHLTMTVSVMASVSGAYLYVAQVAIQGYRARTLLSSDLWWCCARMAIAIPLGLSLSLVASGSIGPFIAFALGAFPTESVFKMIRQLANQNLKTSPDPGEADNLISMLGVTQRVAANLSGEGIDSIQQLADVDPVSLALRTGLSFDYILNLVSQSQVWSFVGSTAQALAPLGLADARIITRMMDGIVKGDPMAVATLNEASQKTGISVAALEFNFNNISADGYTKFLTQFMSN